MCFIKKSERKRKEKVKTVVPLLSSGDCQGGLLRTLRGGMEIKRAGF